jgi:hypothetical protein
LVGRFFVLLGAEAWAHDGIKPAKKGAFDVERSSGLSELIWLLHADIGLRSVIIKIQN